MNEICIRHRARISIPRSFSIAFEETCLFALNMLEETWDQDFEKLLVVSKEDLLLSGNVTLREAFDYLMCYFDTFSKQLNFFSGKKESEAGLSILSPFVTNGT